MKTFLPHFEILPDQQRDLWQHLAPCKDLSFVLYGGTAIALQLGHRSSVDFDFFTHMPFDMNLENEMFSKLPFLSMSNATQKAINTRSYKTEHGVNLSFFGGIDFGKVGKPLITKDGILHVASLDDLMATKLAVILQRVEAKDYKDIAAMLKGGISLEKGLSGASALYGSQFSPPESIKALTFFQGGDLNLLLERDKEILLNAVKQLQIHKIPVTTIISKNLTDEHNNQKDTGEDNTLSPDPF